MKRPVQHQIEDESCRIFQSLLPREWVVRWQDGDYGIDGEVEVFKDEESTGLIFKVQMKGTESPTYLQDGSMSLQMKSNNLQYLVNEISLPVLVIGVDVVTCSCRWCSVQDDPEIRRVLDESEQESVSIHFPVANTIAGQFDDILEKIGSLELFLSSQLVMKATPEKLFDVYSNNADLETVIATFGRQSRDLRLLDLERLWNSECYDQVALRVDALLDDPNQSVEVRFYSLLLREKIQQRQAHLAKSDHYRMVSISKAIGDNLVKLTEHGPKKLTDFAQIHRQASDLQELVYRDGDLFTKWEMEHKQQGHRVDPLLRTMLFQKRSFCVRELISVFEKLLGMLSGLLHEDSVVIYPEACLPVIGAMSLFLARLRLEGINKAAMVYQQQVLLDLSSNALSVAKVNKMWGSVSAIAFAVAYLYDLTQEDERLFAMNKARDIITGIPDDVERSSAEKRLEQMEALFANPDLESELTIDDIKLIYRQQAKSLGIDVDNPKSEIDNIIRIGINDLDPTRVIRNCQQLRVQLDSYGLVAEAMQLYTAGSKTLSCEKHGIVISGIELDVSWSLMQSKYCNACPDRNPHSGEWIWTQQWQSEHESKAR